ncbi:hypothetical protein M413DRAFT_27430 [Hebeloma cylindrosporum]|uniref:Uncharacterized protein n=1 Tax=Hebeloma cylindrosporum TaxID=76867 RepID=A0A0C3CC98_HEBCY|nr:hypothetical protein M413DRAFT_27430 [Hebeloma cylindrosporum h7]
MEAPEAIIANSHHHTQLLNLIADLEYVPQARKQQASYIKDLESQVLALKENIALLAEKTKKERKEHETLRDSTSRRLAHKLIGKKQEYLAKESKEEREYVEALEREITERDNERVTQELLDEAKTVFADLTAKETKYESARAELDALYHRVFDGPTEAFPEDDRLEYELMDAVKRHERIQAALNSESKAAELLARAVKSMEFTQKAMQEAVIYSRHDMWGGGTLGDMLERNALRNAQANASQAEFLVDQARKFSPAVQPVGRVSIAQGSIVSDVFFDNIFTDIAFHSNIDHLNHKIKQSAAQVLLATNRLKVERESARRRQEAAGARVIQLAKILNDRRRELDDFRRATFESYAAEHPPPPSYDAITSPVPTASSPPFPEPDIGPSHDDSARVDKPLPPPPLAQSPQLQPFVPMGIPSPSGAHLGVRPADWGSRNPYAFAMAEQTRKMSVD